ncbi:MAB_1171c family putative transporter [Streptomonospora sediminis]
MLLTGAAWTIPIMVRRRFRDPMRMHLFLALLLLGSGNLVSQPYILRVIDPITFTGFSKITYNVMILSGLCLMVGFLRQVPLRRWVPPWPLEVVACGLSLAGMLLITAFIPPEMRNHVLTSEYLVDWRVCAFYTLGNIYLFFGFTACAVFARRHIKQGYALRKVSLTLISSGLAGLAATCVFRILWANIPAMRVPDQPITNNHNFAFGQLSLILACIGVGLPWIVSMAHIIEERLNYCRQYRDLGQLWSSLMAVYPELMLDDGRTSEKRWFANESDVYRRYVECRDGLTRLSPYIASIGGDSFSHEGGPTCPEAARLVECALAMAASNTVDPHMPRDPTFVFAPRGSQCHDDYEADLNTLINISRELNGTMISYTITRGLGPHSSRIHRVHP